VKYDKYVKPVAFTLAYCSTINRSGGQLPVGFQQVAAEATAQPGREAPNGTPQARALIAPTTALSLD